MENKIIFITIITCLSISIYCEYKKTSNINYLKSHKKCPSSGYETNFTCCIHDPELNNGFVISVNSIKDISKIQKSLNSNDKIFEIKKNKYSYFLINNHNNLKQIIPKCEDMNKEEIMKKINTKDIYYSM